MNLHEEVEDMGYNIVPKIVRCRQCFKVAAWKCDRLNCQLPLPCKSAVAVKVEKPRSQTKGMSDTIAAWIEQNLDWFDTPRTTREVCIALRATQQVPLSETSHHTGNKALRRACEQGLLEKLGTTTREACYHRIVHD